MFSLRVQMSLWMLKCTLRAAAEQGVPPPTTTTASLDPPSCSAQTDLLFLRERKLTFVMQTVRRVFLCPTQTAENDILCPQFSCLSWPPSCTACLGAERLLDVRLRGGVLTLKSPTVTAPYSSCLAS